MARPEKRHLVITVAGPQVFAAIVAIRHLAFGQGAVTGKEGIFLHHVHIGAAPDDIGQPAVLHGGDDDITVGAGKTYMRGGDGADTFRFVLDGDDDRMYDFDFRTDTLDVSAWGVSAIGQLDFDTNSAETRLEITFG